MVAAAHPWLGSLGATAAHDLHPRFTSCGLRRIIETMAWWRVWLIEYPPSVYQP